MWGQTWSNVMDMIIPYKDAEAIDVTSALQEQVDSLINIVTPHLMRSAFLTRVSHFNWLSTRILGTRP